VTTRTELAPSMAAMMPGTPGQSTDGQAAPVASEVLTTLAVLASLRDAQTITSDEYESKKTELLARI